MGYLKEQNIIYVDNIIDKLEKQTDDNLQYCPNDNMRSNVKKLSIYGDRKFIFSEIKTNLGIPDKDDFNIIPNCPSVGRDFSGCCKKFASENSENSENMVDKCLNGHSTGLVYDNGKDYYNICHSEEIQSKINMFNNITEKPAGLEKFFISLSVIIVVIVFYTIFCLPYEFWLRYGNSIQCIYYKVKSTCKNMGSKKSDNNGKLTIIEYIFPDNLHNVPYETCNTEITGGMKGGMKGGREKEGIINSNYIEYHENRSKCINVDFGDDIDDRNSRQFPYNLGEYANKEVKNRFIAMMLKGFSFYFLYTILFIRLVLNKSLSFFSKQYQKIFEKNSWIGSALLILNFFITPFLIIGVIISVIFGILSIFPMLITIMDFVKSINIFKEDIETSPSTQDNPNYYKIYNFSNIFYSLNPKNFDPVNDSFHKNNNFFAIIIGVALALMSRIAFGTEAITTLILLIVCPIGFFVLSKYISLPENSVIIFDLIKKVIYNILLIIPVFFTIIATFAFGMTGGILAGLHSAFSTLFNFYYIPFSNSIEFLDLMKNHSKLLTILLLISVITSSFVGGLGNEVSGILGGLLALYLLYELYNLSK